MEFPKSLIPVRKPNSPLETNLKIESDIKEVTTTAPSPVVPTTVHTPTPVSTPPRDAETVEIDISIGDRSEETVKTESTPTHKSKVPFDKRVTADYLVSAYTVKELKEFAKILGADTSGKKMDIATKIVEIRKD